MSEHPGVMLQRLLYEKHNLILQNEKMRECLVGTRVVIEQLRSHSSPGLHKGFDLWLGRIDEALK